jgi:hypothetical protein
MNTIIVSPTVQRIRRHRATAARRAPTMPAIAARRRATEALGRSAVVFLMGAGFALGAVLPMKSQAAPYSGEPRAVPAVIAAEHFDTGGEGVGYHDRSAGNGGGQFRTGEDVDIVGYNSGYTINNFQTGEWLSYTIQVPITARYDIHLRAATTYSTSAFHIQIDGEDVTGPVTVPNTGGWETYQWVGKRNIRLTAGTHVLKVFSNKQYFNLNSLRIQWGDVPSAPYSGTPYTVPGTIQAEHFDRGGQGVAYYDRAAGNAGKAYRTKEDVDIIAISNGHAINNFQTGEWLKYSIKVAATGQYDISARVASGEPDSAFRVEIDGADVTGAVAVPSTGGWDQFEWVTRKGIRLTAGEHVLTVLSDKQYFNLNSIRITGTDSEPSPAPAQTGARQFFCTFQNSPGECGFGIQAKSNSRVTIVSGGRDGGTAVRLQTLPGDSNLFGSGSSERADLSLSVANTDCYQGKEAWWAHSILFPSDYVPATNGFGVVMDFHQTGSVGQANFHVDSSRWDGLLRFRGYGGIPNQTPPYEKVIGPVVKNQWYDFVYHVRWSSGSDGFMRAWVNGKKKLDHRGPTIYSGDVCYLKLANYHTPFGQPTAVIHDRVIRGSTWQAVSRTTLEGVQ